jgi:hypothetical protein
MPTNRKRVSRNPKPKVEQWKIDFLKRGELNCRGMTDTEIDTASWELLDFTNNLRDTPDKAIDLWDQYREEIMAKWIEKYPGTRPWAWWTYDAPKRESDAAWLKRKGFLTKKEKEYLDKNPSILKPVRKREGEFFERGKTNWQDYLPEDTFKRGVSPEIGLQLIGGASLLDVIRYLILKNRGESTAEE